MGKFEENIKNALDQYSVDYNPAHWKKVESQLKPAAKGSNNSWKIAAGAAILLVGSILAYNFYPESQESKIAPVQENTLDTPAIIQDSEQKPEQSITNAEPAKPEATSTPIETTVVDDKAKPSEVKPQQTEIIISEDELKPSKDNSKKASGLSFAVISDKKSACIKEGIKFSSDVKEPVTYRWVFGDGTESDLPSPLHYYKKPGKYAVSLELTSVISGESKRVLMKEMVVVNAKPQANFDYDIMAAKDFNQKVNFSIAEYNFQFAEWLINGETFDAKNLSLPFNKKGNYPIQLVVQNAAGCYDTLVKYITVANDYNLLAPNAFTPDNDGLNDEFLPEALRDTQLRYDLEVYDASSGKVIFRTNQDGKGWDGTDIRTGTKAKQGDYAWAVSLYKTTGEIEKFKGNIKLLEL